METKRFVSTSGLHPLLNPFVSPAALLADARVQGWTHRPPKVLSCASEVLAFALLLASVAWGVPALVGAVLAWAFGRPLRLLQSLSETSHQCIEALKLVDEFEECAAYRDRVLAQGREILRADLLVMRELELEATWRDELHQRQLAASEFGRDVRDPEGDACARQQRYALLAMGTQTMMIALAWMGSLWSWELLPGVTQTQIFTVLVICANPLTFCGALLVFNNASARMPVSISGTMRESARQLMNDPFAGPYLKALRAQGHVLRRNDLAEAERLSRKNADDACRRLHRIDSIPQQDRAN